MKRSIGLLLLLAGCQLIPGTTAHEIRRAEETVRYGLDDPVSAFQILAANPNDAR